MAQKNIHILKTQLLLQNYIVKTAVKLFMKGKSTEKMTEIILSTTPTVQLNWKQKILMESEYTKKSMIKTKD